VTEMEAEMVVGVVVVEVVGAAELDVGAAMEEELHVGAAMEEDVVEVVEEVAVEGAVEGVEDR